MNDDKPQRNGIPVILAGWCCKVRRDGGWLHVTLPDGTEHNLWGIHDRDEIEAVLVEHYGRGPENEVES